MPKTYNNRQLDQMRLEAEYAPPIDAGPDTTRYSRHFPPDEIASIVMRIEQRVAAGKVTQLAPATALLVVRALKCYMAEPSRDSIVREICGIRGGCEKRCLTCIGRANAIMGLYEGRKVRDED